MSNLASTYSDQRRLKEAEELELHVLEFSKKRLGAEHPSTIQNSQSGLSTESQK